jgi:hypothetical protein
MISNLNTMFTHTFCKKAKEWQTTTANVGDFTYLEHWGTNAQGEEIFVADFKHKQSVVLKGHFYAPKQRNPLKLNKHEM